MKLFSYHQKAYRSLQKRGTICFACGWIVFTVVLLFCERFEAVGPYPIGVGIAIFLCSLLYKMICDQGAKKIRMSSLEVFFDSVCITFSEGKLFPRKGFLRLSYSDLERIEWEARDSARKKQNLNLYHKNGRAAVCIEDVAEAVVLLHENKNRFLCSSAGEEMEEKAKEAECVKISCPSCGSELAIDLEKTSVSCPDCFRELKI